MRCDTQIYFVTDEEKTLVVNPEADNYGDYEVGEPAEVRRYADVTDTQTKTQQLVYGALREGSKTVRLNGQYREPFDHIRIVDRDTGGSALYDVDAKRILRRRSTFICHEVI